jgi:hypothetical protein
MFLITGCSVFQSSRKIDMTPFSENAGVLFGEATKISRPFQWKHLKPYITIPEFANLINRAGPLLEALRGVVYYSNQVVAINNSKLKDREKNRQLARYLYDAMEKSIANQKIDSLQLDEMGARKVLDNIRNADTYLEAITAAGPVVNSVVLAILKRLDEIQAMIDPILLGFDREIEQDYGATRFNYKRLINLQEQMMLSITRLYRARIGDRAELDTLVQENASLTEYLPSTENVSPAQLDSAETHLLKQLHQIDIMLNQLDDAKAEYVAKQDELIAWRIQVDQKIMIARTAMTIWAQSHRNLGAGIPVPPLFDVGGFATGLIGTAANTVIP